MPQPLTSLSSLEGYGMGVEKLASNSKAASLVADCISTWSYFEVQLGCILGALLGTETDAALEIFMSFRKTGRQVEILEIAEKHSQLLSNPETKIKFKAILRVFVSLEKTRNKFAHGCFGDMYGNSDQVLWCEAKDYVLFMSTMIPKIHSGQFISDPHRMLLDKVYVYTISELEKIKNDMRNIEEMSNVFYCHLLNPIQQSYIDAVNRCSLYPVVKESIEYYRDKSIR
jgi:hypothetical protein